MSRKKKQKIKPVAVDEKIKSPAPVLKRPALEKISFFKNHWLPVLIISLFAIGLYFQTVNFDYTLDDAAMITSNKFTQQGIKGIGDIFKYESYRGYLGKQEALLEGDRYRPLSIASFAIEKSLGSNKAISHLINVLLYALTGILLYRILLFFFPASEKKKWFFSVPFVASLLFIVHPLHTEVVANIKGRDEIFALLGEAGSLYFTFKYLSEKKLKWLFLSFFAFLAGLLSKEGVITFLAVIPITIHFFTTATLGEKIKIALPLFGATIIYLLMRVAAIGYLLSNTQITDVMNNPFYGLSFGEKTATIFYTLLLYLKLHIIPYPLTQDYYPYHIPIMHWSDWRPILSLLIHFGLIIIIMKGWKRKTVWAYSASFYLITLSIVSNLVVSVGTFMNERFVYHASLGFCIAVAWLLVEVMAKNKYSKIGSFIIFGILILFFSFRTLARLPDWRNNDTLLKASLKYSPESAKANCFYAMNRWNVYTKLPPNTDTARRYILLDSIKLYFDKSVEILPSFNIPQTMRAYVAAEYHKLNKNYDDLINSFESVNRSGVVIKFVLDYLQKANNSAIFKSDAEKLSTFYSRMIAFYKQYPSTAALVQDYEYLAKEIQSRIPNLN